MFLCSFSLTKNNQKVKADAPWAKNGLRFAKMRKTRCAQTVRIF